MTRALAIISTLGSGGATNSRYETSRTNHLQATASITTQTRVRPATRDRHSAVLPHAPGSSSPMTTRMKNRANRPPI